MRRPLSIAALALVAAGVALVLLLGDDDEPERPERAAAPPRVELVVQDDGMLRAQPRDTVRAGMRELADLGVDRIRVTAPWYGLAPGNESAVKPEFDATESAAYPQEQWRQLDATIEEAIAAGMKPMVDVSFWAPRWAVGRPALQPGRYNWNPSVEEFGLFAEAIAERYSGRYVDPHTGRRLPAVRLWTTWNEPNHPAFLMPQWIRRDGRWLPSAPHHYRAMHEVAYEALKRADPRNRVLVGGTTSIGTQERGTGRSLPPLRFVRELACVGDDLEPLDRRECDGYRPLRADGFSHHPYAFTVPPDQPHGNRDSVTMATLGRLVDLLAELHRRGRIERRLDVYVTEYGFESNPPDPYRGVPLDVQAAYHSQASAMAWRQDGVRMFAQYLVVDIPPDPDDPPGSRAALRTYQTGIKFSDGAHKPARQALKLPLWIDGLRAWAQVRPGRGPQRVAFERMEPDGSWTGATGPLRTDRDGVIERTLPGPGTYRLRWEPRGGSPDWSLPAAATG